MILGICENVDVLKVMNIVVTILKIIQIVVPIVLMFSFMFKAISAMTKKDDDAIASLKKKAVPNIVAAVLIFIVPLLVGIIMNVTLPDSEYTKCIVGISSEKLQQAYEDKAEKLVSKAEETLNINDYVNAMNYMPNVKDKDKRSSYEERLKVVKELIDEGRTIISTASYDEVDYSNFKWTYYKKKTGPVSEIYDEVTPYAIWAPNDVKDLKGVSLPLVVWLHGAGEQSGNSSDESRLLNSGLLKVMSDWNTFNLEAFPAIIVAPQSSTNTWNNTINNNSVRALIKYATDNYKIDTNKIVFMGHSMGGYGVIELSWEMKDIQFYSIVIMSANRSSYKSGSGGLEFYSKQKLRGYSENTQLKDFFTWVNKQNDFTYYKGEQHGRVPMRALTEDLDGNKVSDLIEWLFTLD